MHSGSPFSLRVDGRAHAAREADATLDAAYVVALDGHERGFDLLEEVLELEAIDPRRGVALDFGRLELELRRAEGRVYYRAAAVVRGARVCSSERRPAAHRPAAQGT